jgi:hypothetical protein
MPGGGTWEAELAATEARAESALRSVAGLARELKKARAAAAVGTARELRRALEGAESLAAQLADTVRAVREGYDVDESAHLTSGDYTKELLAAAVDAGLALYEEDDRLLCYPSLVRLLPGEVAVEIDKRRDRRLRPSVLVATLAAAQRRGPRFLAEPFLDSLRAGYDLVIARDHRQPDAVARLVDVHEVLTLLPGQARDYSRQEFARDLYSLDQSGVMSTGKDRRRLRWAASTGTRGSGVLTTVARGGQQRRYWGIAFEVAP